MSNPATQFKKGVVANPNGRPKKEWTMTELYRQAGEEADETGVPRKKIVAKKLWDIAKKGDVIAIKELNNRLDGMPKQPLEHTGTVNVIPILGGLSTKDGEDDNKEEQSGTNSQG